MKNVNKQEYVSYLLTTRLQTTEKPSWETRKFFTNNHELRIPSLSSLNDFHFYLIHLIFCLLILSSSPLCYIPLQSKPDWNTLTIFTRCHAKIIPAFSLYLFICTQFGHRHAQTTRCHVFVRILVIHMFEPDTDNNELSMTNSVCRTPPYQLSLDITVFFFVCVFVCLQLQQINIYRACYISCETTKQYISCTGFTI